jgi:hypothetical protein
MSILERELKSTMIFGENEYGETKFAEIDNLFLKDFERAFMNYFTTWI